MAQTTIGTLKTIISADSKPFEKGLNRSKQSMKQFQKSTTDLTAYVKKMSTALVAAAGVTGFGAIIKSATDAADRVAKAAGAIGETTENLSRLKYAGEQTGVAFEQLNIGLKTMSKNIVDAANGTGEARDAFRTLGVEVSSLRNKSPRDAFIELTKAFGTMNNATDKTNAAMRIFGESGVALINTMNLGADGVKSLEAEADKLGITLQSRDARAAEEVRDSINKLLKTISGAATNVIGEFADTFTTIANSVTSVIAGFKTLIQWLDAVTFGVVSAGAKVAILVGFYGALVGSINLAVKRGVEIVKSRIAEAKATSTSTKAVLAHTAAVKKDTVEQLRAIRLRSKALSDATKQALAYATGANIDPFAASTMAGVEAQKSISAPEFGFAALRKQQRRRKRKNGFDPFEDLERTARSGVVVDKIQRQRMIRDIATGRDQISRRRTIGDIQSPGHPFAAKVERLPANYTPIVKEGRHVLTVSGKMREETALLSKAWSRMGSTGKVAFKGASKAVSVLGGAITSVIGVFGSWALVIGTAGAALYQLVTWMTGNKSKLTEFGAELLLSMGIGVSDRAAEANKELENLQAKLEKSNQLKAERIALAEKEAEANRKLKDSITAILDASADRLNDFRDNADEFRQIQKIYDEFAKAGIGRGIQSNERDNAIAELKANNAEYKRLAENKGIEDQVKSLVDKAKNFGKSEYDLLLERLQSKYDAAVGKEKARLGSLIITYKTANYELKKHNEEAEKTERIQEGIAKAAGKYKDILALRNRGNDNNVAGGAYQYGSLEAYSQRLATNRGQSNTEKLQKQQVELTRDIRELMKEGNFTLADISKELGQQVVLP